MYSYNNRLSLKFSDKRAADFWYNDICKWKSNFNSSIIVKGSDPLRSWGVKHDVCLDNIKKVLNLVTATYLTSEDINTPVLNQLYLDIKDDDSAVKVSNIFISDDKKERGYYCNGDINHSNLSQLFKANLIENSLFDYKKIKVFGGSGTRANCFYFEYRDEDYRVDIEHQNKTTEYNYSFSNLLYGEEYICSSIDFLHLPIIKYKDELFLFESDILDSLRSDPGDKPAFGLGLFL